MKYVLLAIVAVTLGCTSNQRARRGGGTMVVDLKPGQSLKFATWKESNLWYATEPRKPGIPPSETTMQEDSAFGLVQGTVVFREH